MLLGSSIFAPHKAQSANQRRHRQSLHKDREGHDGESRHDNLVAFNQVRRKRQRQRKSQRAAQTAPHQDMLITLTNRQT